MLLRKDAFLTLNGLSCHLALYALLLRSTLLGSDKLRLALCLVLQSSVNGHIRLRYALKAKLTALVLPVKADRCVVIRVVLHVELLVSMRPPPFMVGNTGTRKHFVRSLLALNRNLYAARRERAGLVRPYPEHILHVSRRNLRRARVARRSVHFFPRHAGRRMCHSVPFRPGFHVGGLQLV